MARRKKKDNPAEADSNYSSVKCALGSIIKEPFRQLLIEIISKLSITATKIAYLASLLFLFVVSE